MNALGIAYDSSDSEDESDLNSSNASKQKIGTESGTESGTEGSPSMWNKSLESDEQMEIETNPDAASEYSCQLRRLSRCFLVILL